MLRPSYGSAVLGSQTNPYPASGIKLFALTSFDKANAPASINIFPFCWLWPITLDKTVKAISSISQIPLEA